MAAESAQLVTTLDKGCTRFSAHTLLCVGSRPTVRMTVSIIRHAVRVDLSEACWVALTLALYALINLRPNPCHARANRGGRLRDRQRSIRLVQQGGWLRDRNRDSRFREKSCERSS